MEHGNAVAQPDERIRANQALQLRLAGHTYEVIAERLGWSDESGARHAVTRLLDRTEVESASQLRQIARRPALRP